MENSTVANEPLLERPELLERFRAGEQRALEEVYRLYVSDVAVFLSRGFSFQSRGRTLKFGGFKRPFDLDNAIQETFLRAFREPARRGFDGKRAYRLYLFAIARNYVIDELRAGEGGQPSSEDQVIDPQRSQEERYLQEVLGLLFNRFVKGLDERDSQVFRARFEDERTLSDTGKHCGLSMMQVRTVEKKLKRQFFRFMESTGHLEELKQLAL